MTTILDQVRFPSMETSLQEIRIQGRTEALDFVGTLITKWKKMAEESRAKTDSSNATSIAYDECAYMLEKKMEEFANT